MSEAEFGEYVSSLITKKMEPDRTLEGRACRMFYEVSVCMYMYVCMYVCLEPDRTLEGRACRMFYEVSVCMYMYVCMYV